MVLAELFAWNGSNKIEKGGWRMKKGCLFIIMLLLAACGGGGGGAAVSGGGQPVATATGAVSLQFVDGTKQASAKTVASLTAVSAGRVRIVISNSAFKKVVDLPFGSPDTTVTLPVGVAYTAEAVYYESGSPNRLTEHGVSAPFTVASDTTSAAPVTMTPITAAITPPASVFSGSTYNVTASTPVDLAAVGLQKEWSLAVAMTPALISASVPDPFTGSLHLGQTPSELHTGVAAPVTDKPGRLYFQGEFFIKAALLDVGESASNWSFTVEPALNVSTELKVTTIDGPINLPADTAAPQITSFTVPSSKQGTATITPISIKAIDNAGIAGYMITLTNVAPDGAVDLGWSAAMPTSYTYTGALNGSGLDSSVTLYAWVRDFSGNVSAAGASATKTVIINDSPVVKSFSVPAVTQFGTLISPITFTGKNNTGADTLLRYLITETAVKPLAGAFPVAAGAPNSYLVNSVNQVSGTKYSVNLYAWVMDANGSISQSLNNGVTINDVPQVTAFTVAATVTNGNVADILSFTGSAASGSSISKYLITTTSAKPVAADFTSTSRPLTFSYPYAATSTGLTVGVSATKTLYAWVLDDATPGRISLVKTANVRFLAP
jgi:hypothetical protein